MNLPLSPFSLRSPNFIPSFHHSSLTKPPHPYPIHLQPLINFNFNYSQVIMPERDYYPPPGSDYVPSPYLSKSYELSGKIMLTAIIILFFIVFLMVSLHLYLRCYLLRSRTRRHHLPRTRRRRTHLVFYVDPHNNNATVPSQGLDAAVLKSLPLFVFSGETHPEPLECAVCLSEFEENETGRTLPKCKHSFHIGCIDMWFHSHSSCPLCRSAVESAAEVSISVSKPESISSPAACPTCDRSGNSNSSLTSVGGTSLFSERSKPEEIEIPMRNKSFEEDSAASQSFRSPMSRMLSFTRILSRDRRGPMSPSSDIEIGSEESRRASES